MKKIISFLSLLLCYPLVACDHYTTTADITYVIEEAPAYPSHHYLPLLDIIQQFKDFHEEELTTKENPYTSKEGEGLAAITWDVTTEAYNAGYIKFIANLEGNVMNLLQATTTINGYLAKLATIQDDLFAARASCINRYLLGIENNVSILLLPTSKRLFNFLMEDKASFAGYEEGNERTRLRAITRFELLNQLIQTAIDLTNSNDLNEGSMALLTREQAIAACKNPEEVGDPYGLLERLTFSNGLSSAQNKHCMELKQLLQFDQLREKYPHNFEFIRQLFIALNMHTDPAIIPPFLQLIKDRPIKIWFLASIEKPKDIQYSVDPSGNTRITSPLEPVLQRLAQKLAKETREEIPQENATTYKWLVYIEGLDTKNNKQRRNNLTATTRSHQSEKKQPHKPTNTPPQRTQDISHAKPQEKPNKKKAQKPKKPISKAPSIHDSLEDNIIPISTSSLSKKLTPVTPLQPISTTIETALSSLPTIEEQENIDHPTVSPTTISFTLTTQATSNNTSLTLPTTLKEPTMDHLTPTVEEPVLLPAKQPSALLPASTSNKPAKKKAPIKIIIAEKPAEQLASPKKEKKQQQAGEKTQQKEPIKKILSSENSSPIPQPTFSQGPIQANPQRHFIMPRGLRSFHAAQLQTAYPIIPYPKHQATINQLFNPACNITYKVFETLWITNGGNIMHKGGSHCTLQFPQGTNLFGIYKPHGASDTYGTKAIQYLRAAALYIGLRPTDWS